jgi:microcystin-dependent protein
MALFYVGEIVLLPYTFAPVGFLPCDGRTLAISEYETLFNLIGTTYGGDGQSTFNLPDFRGRAPIHMGTGQGVSYVLGESGGSETVSVSAAQLPAHTHTPPAFTARLRGQSAGGASRTPVGNVLAGEATGVTYPYSDGAADAAMAANTITLSGATQPSGSSAGHNNLQPSLAMMYCISVEGVFPSSA